MQLHAELARLLHAAQFDAELAPVLADCLEEAGAPDLAERIRDGVPPPSKIWTAAPGTLRWRLLLLAVANECEARGLLPG